MVKSGRPKGSQNFKTIVKNLQKQIGDFNTNLSKAELEKSYIPGVAAVDFSSQEASVPFNKRTITECYDKDLWVRAIVEAIGAGCVAAGWRFVPDKTGQELNKRWVEALLEFMDRPNEEDTFDDLLEELFINLALYHVAYWFVPFSLNKYPKFVKEVDDTEKPMEDIEFPFEIYNLSPATMKIKVGKDGKTEKYIQKSGTKTQEYSPDEIVYFRMPTVNEEVYSKSPVQTLARVIASDLYAETYNGAFFENNATPRLHIDIGNVNEKDFSRVVDVLESQLKGKPHANLITKGNIKVNPISITNKDMEFSTYSDKLREKIFAIWRMQPIILGITGGTKESVSQQISLFRTLVVNRYQRIVRNRVNRKIIKRFFKKAKAKMAFNPLGALDVQEQIKLEEHDLKNLIKTVNEVRLDRGLEATEWGNILMIPYSNAEQAIISPQKIKDLIHGKNGEKLEDDEGGKKV
ncbi:hypothetical protein COS91_01555 [Candidatus Desantisbacteria bacterium CG07_land_8_20_14_0_80_39_15]|uniref:Phage portal protein n=1 Tax=Candidatus Desantisbacteria bacterium CG07_land_8_20_14_0_80_39_15 TaxID=1974549 RepID=A0A2M6ZI03_9BACT|nr:MAG: hypothetical protein COS91_01555 [Candidatus Desantisbacteria bacterium CG07_land_8_20_14_0_80_39_15]